MKKIKKFGALLLVFILNFYNTCLADSVWFDPATGKFNSNNGGLAKQSVIKTSPEKYVIIGILVLVVIVCTICIIRRIIKKKKEQEKQNDNDNK